jgi:hypothetical protein
MLRIAAILLAVAVPAIAQSQPITAGEFLTRAEPLLKKSKAALVFSGEARKMMRTLGDSAKRNRERLDADRAAGRKLTTCLPPKGEAEIKADELLAYLRGLPPQRKAQSFDSALASFLARKYPCG